MDGLIYLKDMDTKSVDLVNKIAKLGYHDTPLFNMIQKAVPSAKTETALGHTWLYEQGVEADADNAHKEGSAPAEFEHGVLGESKNHFQIIKHSYGITGSMEGKTDIEGTTRLAKEGTRKAIQHRLTIEKLLFSDQAPQQRTAENGMLGKAGGLKHWCTNDNTLALSTDDISIKFLREMFKIGYYEGMPTTHIFVSDKQKDKLDDIYASIVRGTVGMTVMKDTNYHQLENFAYAPKVKVIMSKYVNDDEILGINAGSLALAYQRLTAKKDIPTGDDVIQKQLISELTLRVNNPYGVTRISGLKVD
jgi:hypothetical protein